MELLTYTPHQDRDLCGDAVSRAHVDCQEDIDWDRPQIYRIWRSTVRDEAWHRLPLQFLHMQKLPCIVVYTDDESGDTSSLVFYDRETYRAAWSVARAIHNGRVFIQLTRRTVWFLTFSDRHFFPEFTFPLQGLSLLAIQALAMQRFTDDGRVQ